MKVKSLIRVPLFETPWTAAYQAPPSMGFSRQEYWSGVRVRYIFIYDSDSLLEKEMATHSRVLAWRIPGMGEPDGLLSMGSHRVRHD